MSVREVAPTTQATSGSGRCAGRWTRGRFSEERDCGLDVVHVGGLGLRFLRCCHSHLY